MTKLDGRRNRSVEPQERRVGVVVGTDGFFSEVDAGTKVGPDVLRACGGIQQWLSCVRCLGERACTVGWL